MKLENHMLKLKEHLDGLEWGIRQNNHSAIGFHASQGAVELVSIYLHKLNLITADIQLKHTWFRSANLIGQKLDFEFPNKQEILGLVGRIEDLRNPLCYGSPRPEESLDAAVSTLRKLKSLIEKELGDGFG